ncbi:MAG: site-2 protease family protein [Dehalococcoidales bacterium]|nr:site-2 protease family protein [Dehalococcoidales bacterium]
MDRSFRIGKLFGIEFRLHYTWFFIFLINTILLVEPNYQSLSYWLIGLLSSMLFFASVLAHELAHCLVGRAQGMEISNITLFIFGGVATMKGEMNRPGAEFRMTIAGPLCNVVIGGIFGLLLLVPGIDRLFMNMFTWLAITNGILAVFNLIPGFPLDGGRIFRSIVWKTTGSYLLATRIATAIGRGVGYLFILAGIFIIIFGPFGMTWFNGLWICFIGWFLSTAASSAWRAVIHQQQPQPQASSVITDASYTVMTDDGKAEE